MSDRSTTDEVEALRRQVEKLTQENAQERQRAEQERQRAEQERQRAEQERHEKDELQHEKDEQLRQNILELAIPELGFRKMSDSTSQKATVGSRVLKTGPEVPVVDDLALSIPDGSYSDLEALARDGWTSEFTIQKLVDLIFGRHIVRSLSRRPREELTTRAEVGLKLKRSDGKGQRADLLVVRSAQGDAIGAIECKIPLYTTLNGKFTGALEEAVNNSAVDVGDLVGTLEKRENIDQLKDYMNSVRSFDGLVHMFGILSNYHEYRFCWFGESDKLVASRSTKEVKEACREEVSAVDSFRCSRVYRFNEKDMAKRLAGFVWRMRCAMHIRNPKGDFFEHEGTTVDLVLSKTTAKYLVSARVSVKVGDWVLWEFLGSGASGSVWKAYQRSESPKDLSAFDGPYALKLLFATNKDGAPVDIQREIEAWRLLQRQTETLELNGADFLRMPFYEPLQKGVGISLVHDELARLANSGIQHEDLELRHLRWDAKAEEVRVVDFGYWEKATDSSFKFMREIIDSKLEGSM